MKRVLVALALIATPAAAQQGVCGQGEDAYACQARLNAEASSRALTQSTSPAATFRALMLGSDYVNSLADRAAAAAQQRQREGQREHQAAYLKQIGALVADGQCAEARRTALREGDLDRVPQIDAICRPH